MERDKFDPKDILRLASGTVSCLTGIDGYVELAHIQWDFYNAVIGSGCEFSHWKEAWAWYMRKANE